MLYYMPKNTQTYLTTNTTIPYLLKGYNQHGSTKWNENRCKTHRDEYCGEDCSSIFWKIEDHCFHSSLNSSAPSIKKVGNSENEYIYIGNSKCKLIAQITKCFLVQKYLISRKIKPRIGSQMNMVLHSVNEIKRNWNVSNGTHCRFCWVYRRRNRKPKARGESSIISR